jgi:hypothetical protein
MHTIKLPVKLSMWKAENAEEEAVESILIQIELANKEN